MFVGCASRSAESWSYAVAAGRIGRVRARLAPKPPPQPTAVAAVAAAAAAPGPMALKGIREPVEVRAVD